MEISECATTQKVNNLILKKSVDVLQHSIESHQFNVEEISGCAYYSQ